MTVAQAYEYDAARIAALKAAYGASGPLERAFYTSPEVLRADLDRIWRRHWLYVAHGCELAEAGAWKTYAVGDDRIVLVRGRDGVVRAFHNVCRHRGARVCSGERGKSALLVCPYHAWTYELDGRLRTATEREFGLASDMLGLRPVAIKDLGGLLFVALGPEPVDFEAGAGEIAAGMRHQGFCDAKLAHTIRYTVKANWKLIFENNRECYHCDTAHPEYVSGTYDTARFDPRRAAEVARETELAEARFTSLGLGSAVASSAMTGGWWRVSRAPLMTGWQTQSLDGRPIAPLMGRMREAKAWSQGTLRATVFPNFWQHASDDHAVATRLTPIDATTTEVVVSWFVHRDAIEGRDYEVSRLLPFWQRTSEQDWSICEANQEGVSSPAYTPGPYSRTREPNLQHFIDWYLGALGNKGSSDGR
ncbi:MAG TPA: aromatic ring-hydroxylating dioxygenase subunit alpha [Hyphomicrobiaceae bacterium]|nr:aromatic ring-hydroxylating dioxygenase subunit alpha [Hyphomicrobiaceae bacterium]